MHSIFLLYPHVCSKQDVHDTASPWLTLPGIRIGGPRRVLQCFLSASLLALFGETLTLSVVLSYLVAPKVCHRFVGYLEEEAVLTVCPPLFSYPRGPLMNGSTLDASMTSRPAAFPNGPICQLLPLPPTTGDSSQTLLCLTSYMLFVPMKQIIDS